MMTAPAPGACQVHLQRSNLEENKNDDVVFVRYEEEDDHGHSTLIFHGEPEPVAAIMASALLILDALAVDVGGVDVQSDSDEPGIASAA